MLIRELWPKCRILSKLIYGEDESLLLNMLERNDDIIYWTDFRVKSK